MEKEVFLLCLAICILFTLSSVCASDVNDTAIVSDNADQVIGEVGDDVASSSENEDFLSVADDGTFTSLQKKIDNATSGSEIILENDYVYNEGFSADGINISKSLTIDGKGRRLDGDNQARIFNVIGSGVVFKDIIFVNGKTTGSGGAIYGGCTVINCTFTNNNATLGGAVNHHSGMELSAINCIFNNNLANEGGAMYGGSAVNCTFAGNIAERDGGAIFNGSAINCTFIGNTATHHGGAIHTGDGDFSAEDCTFVGNSADGGGATYGIDVVGCIFTNNTSTCDGGAVYKGDASDCTFAGNIAERDGGAIFYGGAINCTFIGNTAKDHGGAIHTGDGDFSAEDCTFIGNTVFRYGGGATYGVDAINCIFTNNTSLYDGGAMYGKVKATNCNFTGNHAENEGGDGYDVNFNNCNFINNTEYKNSFKALHDLIYNCGSTLELDRDYYFHDGGDDDFSSNGIKIDKSITIDGKGYTIDAQGKARIFNIQEKDVTIKNLTIKNAYCDGDGGAIYFTSSGTVENCDFIDNNVVYYGGAVFFADKGIVENCNFTNNNAHNQCGGAIYFDHSGTVENCNFANNEASLAGAIYFNGRGTVENCNFTNNSAEFWGGAIRFYSKGTVTNCNFIDNKITGGYPDGNGGAIYFFILGNVINSNFTNNTSYEHGGAIYCEHSTDNFSIENCNFIDNQATRNGGAVYLDEGAVTNCNFINNQATGNGGAVYFNKLGNVTNCYFNNNTVDGGGGAIHSMKWATVADACIFKTSSDTKTNVITRSPTLNVDNFTSFYGSGEKLTFDLTTNSGIPITNGNISISVYFKDNNRGVCNYTCLSGEGWILDLPVGEYYATFYTQYDGFKEINRTIEITMPAGNYYINVTSIITNNKTVNITAISDIPKNILWGGKLLFILSNGTEINATYAANGTWWEVYTFADYGDHQVNASYEGLDNVTINNAIISIVKANSTVNVADVVLNYGDSKNVNVTTEGATRITAMINGESVTVVNNFTILISGLDVGNYTLEVTTIPDGDHESVTKTANVTVNKASTEIILTNKTVDLKVFDEITTGATLTPADAGNLTYTSSNSSVAVVENGKIKAISVGTAVITVSFSGNANYYATKNKTIEVTVSKMPTEIVPAAITTVYNVNKNIIITLKDAKGNAISGVELTVNLNGAKTYKTDKNGQIKINVAKLVPKAYTAKISFAGNNNYKASSATVKVTVNKAKSKIVAKKKTFKKAKKVKKYTITLKSGKTAIKKVQVTLKIKGKTYKAKTNSKGKATFKITKLNKKGTYKSKITYKGSKYFKKSTKSVKIKVK